MGCRVVISPGYEQRFDLAVGWRMTYYGANSAQRLLEAQERAEMLLSTTPLMGALVDGDSELSASEDLRWIMVDAYVAIYRSHLGEGVIVLEDLFHSSEDWRNRAGN